MRCDMSYGCEVRAAGEKRKDTRKQHRDPDHETDDGHDRRVPTRGGRHGGRGESCGAGKFLLRRKKSKPRLSHRNVHSSYYLLYNLSAIHCAAARPNAPGLTTHVPRHLRQMHTTHIATATWHPTPWPFPAPASASWRVLVLVLGSLSSLARSPSLHRRALSLFSLEFPLSSPGTNNHHATCNFSSSPVDCSSFLPVSFIGEYQYSRVPSQHPHRSSFAYDDAYFDRPFLRRRLDALLALPSLGLVTSDVSDASTEEASAEEEEEDKFECDVAALPTRGKLTCSSREHLPPPRL